MFEPPTDAVLLWTGLSAVSVAVLAVALSLPTAPPPAATGVAATVDGVASSPNEARAQRPVRAAAMRLGPYRIALRTAAGRAHASFAYGPVTPAVADARLQALLHGESPSSRFQSPAALRNASERARERDPAWRPAPDTIAAKRVVWGDVRVTLVGA